MRGLVVFDYDWSLINDNSDTFVFEKLQPELVARLKQRSKDGVQWTRAVDETLAELQCTRQELIDAIAQVPVQPGMLDAVHHAHEHGWEVVIVSDANTVFIDSFLELHKLTNIIKRVFTNRSEFVGEILHVLPYHPAENEPHGCPRCPVNMCKGSILRNIKAEDSYEKILYIGDGNGDFCPSSTQLSSGDVVFARENYDLLKRLRESADQVSATVVPWSTGQDILAGFREHIV